MAYPFDESFDVYGLNRKNRLDRLMRDPYSSQLTEPGLMDSSQQSENPFGGLFKPSNLQSIGSASDPSVSAKPAQSDDENLSESIRKMMELNNQYYHPEHTASDRLNQLLNSFPQEKRPSIGRTIVAGLAGMGAKEGGGYDASQKVIDEPFKGDLEKWKAQTQPAYQAAEAENQGNVNQRTLLGNMITAETANQRNRATQKIAEDKNRIQEDKNKAQAETSMIRARALEYKNHGWEIDTKGSRVMAINPNTLERKDLGPTDNLDQRDLEDLKGKWGVAKAEASGMSAIERTIAAGQGIFQTPDGKKWRSDPNNPDQFIEVTGASPGALTKPGTDKQTGPEKPLDVSRDRVNNLNEAYDRHPEWRDFLSRQGTDIVIKKRPEPGYFSYFNNDEDIKTKQKSYDDMMDFVYGSKQSKNTSSGIGPSRPATMMDRFGIPSKEAISPENAPQQLSVPPRPSSIPPGAKAQYNTGTGQWRYLDSNGKWIIVGGK